MSDARKEVIEIFRHFMKSVLIDHQLDEVIQYLADDIIGIGMGTQGIVTNKEDVIRIADDETLNHAQDATIKFDHMLVHCFDDSYATICGVVRLRNKVNGKLIESGLGQLMNMRKVDGQWIIYTMQATPLFNEIEEMEAYPIKFAETILEKYRQQEQIAKIAQQDSIGIYLINFTKGICEDCVIKNNLLIQVEPGDLYEETLFEAARRYLTEEDRFRFISLFTIGNVFKQFNQGNTELSIEYQMSLPTKLVWMKSMVKLYIDNKDQSLKGYFYVIDINEDKTKELLLKNDAELDPLTGLYNRKYAEANINAQLKHSTIHERGAFFMIDLDHFKDINDTFGHLMGDDILKLCARSIQSVIRKDDIAGRLGGDEFCIYFQGTITRDVIIQKAELLCQAIREISNDKTRHISCSIGIAWCRGETLSFDDVYQQADQALYLQKSKGRNGYTIFQE